MVESGHQMAAFASVHAELDKDGDGVVIFNEFVAWMKGIGCLDE